MSNIFFRFSCFSRPPLAVDVKMLGSSTFQFIIYSSEACWESLSRSNQFYNEGCVYQLWPRAILRIQVFVGRNFLPLCFGALEIALSFPRRRSRSAQAEPLSLWCGKTNSGMCENPSVFFGGGVENHTNFSIFSAARSIVCEGSIDFTFIFQPCGASTPALKRFGQGFSPCLPSSWRAGLAPLRCLWHALA